MLSHEEEYFFDLNGYVLVKGALPLPTVSALREFLAPLAHDLALFDINFLWTTALANLIDAEPVYSKLNHILGPTIRVDHAFAGTERFTANTRQMHHTPFLAHKGLFYDHCRGKIFTGLVGVIYCLVDGGAAGGFCCVPGSHKSAVSTPPEVFAIADNPLVRNVQQEPGDAIIFTEALTHGTYPPGPGFNRLSVFIKYSPGWMAYRRRPPQALVQGEASPTPGYATLALPPTHDETLLSARQREMLSPEIYARDRAAT